jgi:hypothetical protein
MFKTQPIRRLVVRIIATALVMTALGNGRVLCRAQGLPVAMTKIGNPAFDLVDVNLFSADFVPTMPFEVSRIIMPHHALVLDQSSGEPGFGPRRAHAPPYDTELSDGIAAAGFKTGMVYDRVDFSHGVGLAFMQIPNANSPVGKTPDYESGAALALNTYPYTVSITVHFEGQPIVVDDRVSDPYPATAGTLVYEDGSPITYAGLLESHLPTTAAIGAPLEAPAEFILGDYEYRVRFLDANGNGWEFTAPFSVVPEPGFVALLIGALPLFGRTRRRSSCRAGLALPRASRERRGLVAGSEAGQALPYVIL